MNDPVAIVGEAVAGHETAVRRSLVKLAEEISKHTFDAAELLCEVQGNKMYLKWKFESFAEYAEIELGLKVRKAEYLARIAKVCKACGVKREDYEGAGLTNLRSITTLDPEAIYFDPETKQHTPMVELITDLIARAPEMSSSEVAEEVAKLKGQVGDEALITRSYTVTKSCYENTIQRCFELLRRRLGSAGRDGFGAAREYSDGAVLECLAAEFLSDPRNFMEEYDASQDQIELPTEENNADREHAPSGTLDKLDSEEMPQDTFQGSSQPFVLPTED